MVAIEGPAVACAAGSVRDPGGVVRTRARQRCEYCLAPQAGFHRSFHIEHVIAKQHGGTDEVATLALACWECNFRKGPNLAGLDPESRSMVRLFHPRVDRWAEHFSLSHLDPAERRAEIGGLTPMGRATVRLLDFNGRLRPGLRYELWLEGLFQADS